jgi:hypothetical protein
MRRKARFIEKSLMRSIRLFLASLVEMNLRNTIEGRTERKSLCNEMYY